MDRIHRLTKLPKPTLIRILGTLVHAGYVFHVSRRDGYALTEKILRLSAGFRYLDAIVNIARPLLEGFTAKHKWQISIGTPDEAAMRVRFNTRHMSPFAPDQMFLNRRIGMLETGLGRAYLAYCPDSERSVILDMIKPPEPDSPSIAVEPILADIRKRRYATIQRGPGDRVRSFAVPVFGAGETAGAVASLAMFYFGSVMTEDQATSRYLDEVYDVSHTITASLPR